MRNYQLAGLEKPGPDQTKKPGGFDLICQASHDQSALPSTATEPGPEFLSSETFRITKQTALSN